MTQDIRIPPSWWLDRPIIIELFRRCRQRILIVTDGLNYNPASGFGLTRFIEQLAAITPSPFITKAHLGSDPNADDQGFRFATAAPAVTTANYDQVWLFGIGSGASIVDQDVAVISRFMEDGGGVFATGDHERLGYSLSGELPRIRKMRDWTSTPMSVERIDTVTNPGPDRRSQFDDQSDDIPQRVFPHYYGSGSSWTPHALLRSPIGDIDVLPDHPHESRCLVGTNHNQRYQLHGLDQVEFPVIGGGPLEPEVIATSMSAGRYLNPPGSVVGKPPTTPRSFGAISVWDGHRVSRGRIVCDATWHHFVNVNLDGTESVAAPGNNRVGLRDPVTLALTSDYLQIARYYRNIADWLVPVGRRWCKWWIDILVERYRFPLFEEFVPLPQHPCPWDPRVVLGAQVEAALERHHGQGFASELAHAALVQAGQDELAELIRPARTTDSAHEARANLLIDADELRRGVLGSVFDAMVRDLPANPYELENHLTDDHDEAVTKQVVAGVTGAAGALNERQSARVENTLKFFNKLK